ncbi:uncharacterized protein GIQ15_01843 [Arthroderma uncinatum]|uniref:uncharacterized protein n=1 Tax=Arthroderma uncinatum TaxID=74035 RepID=UPI00144AA6DC|nr:uncharacterized protein GIQ15_01843 [Arthroderma uncinatum]KAF3492326.1 hypothetical protein GIQ15_01843 [Arthroderma uncinatum]
MHQRPRPASRPASEASNPALSADGRPLTEKQVQDQITKLNQIVQNYHTKAALIILHSRTVLRPIYKDGIKRVNKWFNVEVDDTDALREDLTQWRVCTATDRRPEPLVIETYIDTSQLTNYQDLVILDDCNKRWDVLEALSNIPGGPEKRKGAKNDVILERWFIELGPSASALPRDMTHILPTTYKKCIITFRSLFAYSKFLPAWKFSKRQSKVTTSPVLRLQHRILPASKSLHGSRSDTLTIPLHDGGGDVVENYSFGVTESPAGPLSIRVTYRTNCEFRVDDSETLLSSRFMGADDDLFRPSLPTEDDNNHHRSQNADVGSLPARHRTSNNPDLSQAYGSMSTFHRADPGVKGSPISALRAARELGGGSPSPPTFMPSPKLGHARLASLSGEDAQAPQRRPSVSYQPFKAPSLSASPALSATRSPSSREPVNMNVNQNQLNHPAPLPRTIPNSSARPRSAHILPDQAVFSSMSASPKQTPISRYSSSFSHRRGRLSTGGGSKTEEDNNSSGKASISSSSAAAAGQRNSTSGVFPVIDADEDNISDFLKLLDQRKDLLSHGPDSSTFDSSSKRTTTAALSRFQRMKDANTALSDSMTSSLLLHRSATSSSSSKQLPPAATSNPNPIATSVPNAIPSGVSGSISSSPGKAISPHTPHTPAIPSRLSSNSVIEYPNPNEPGHITTTTTRSRRAPRHGSPLGETQEPEPESEAGPESQTTTTANAIDIPLPASPHHRHHRSAAFIPNFRRSSSAAQHRTSTTANSNNTATGDEDGPDFLPFPTTTRSISLGAQDRSPPSISELLQTASPDPENQPPPSSSVNRRGNEDICPQPDRDGDSDSVKERSTSGYQPRFAQRHDRDTQAHTSSHTHARRASMRRFSTTRSPWGASNTNPASNPHSSGNMDEDEPLLFTMSDFGVGASQRATTGGNTLESRNRRRDRDRDREGDGGGSGSGGGNPCSFHPWD